MAQDHDNLVLRPRRKIRSRQDEDSLRLRHGERRLDEVKDSMIAAMGEVGDASTATEVHGQDMDDMREKIAYLERRLADQEART